MPSIQNATRSRGLQNRVGKYKYSWDRTWEDVQRRSRVFGVLVIKTKLHIWQKEVRYKLDARMEKLIKIQSKKKLKLILINNKINKKYESIFQQFILQHTDD